MLYITVDMLYIMVDTLYITVDTLYITVAACAFALGLSVWAGLHDRRKLVVAAERERERKERDVRGGGDVRV
jgi:hypothetical protein